MNADSLLVGLQDGEKFSYADLSSSVEGLNRFWDWWRVNGEVDSFQIRIPPSTIQDDDELLIPTIKKEHFRIPINTDCWVANLRDFVQEKVIPVDVSLGRQDLRNSAHDFMAAKSEHVPDAPQLVLTGGGYGAGKTTVVESFLQEGALSLTLNSTMGCDICRDLIPEYSQIISVLDSRGSLVCKDESYLLLDRLLDALLESKRSFIWDSTLQYSDKANSIIEKARHYGYEIYLLGVTIDPSIALERAYERAVEIRRFLNSEDLMLSHRRFARNLPGLIEQVDFAYIYDSTIPDETPQIIAKKEGKDTNLVIVKAEEYEQALERGRTNE